MTAQSADLDAGQRAEAAMQLRALLGAIYAGHIEVTDVQGAYLAGVLDGLEVPLTPRRSGLDSNTAGRVRKRDVG